MDIVLVVCCCCCLNIPWSRTLDSKGGTRLSRGGLPSLSIDIFYLLDDMTFPIHFLGTCSSWLTEHNSLLKCPYSILRTPIMLPSRSSIRLSMFSDLSNLGPFSYASKLIPPTCLAIRRICTLLRVENRS
jgi:hypothetical protein